MSTAKKGAGIQFVIPKEAETAAQQPAADTMMPRSGVGMVALSGMANAGLRREFEEAKERLRSTQEELEGIKKSGTPPVKLDPRKIRVSRWANRHEASFKTPEFIEFKEDLREAGCNLIPIKVRPIVTEDGFEYELVYGHRRHRASLELGQEVLAIVQVVDDKQLFVDMDRENRNRSSLSIYEQGASYLRGVEAGLFKNYVAMAAEMGISVATISKAVKIASLPQEVVNCFSAPIAISFRMGAALSEAHEKDPLGLLGRAAQVFSMSPRPGDEEVLNLLLQAGAKPLTSDVLKVGDKKVGTFKVSPKGAVQVAFKLPAMPESKRLIAMEKISQLLQDLAD